MRNNLKELSVTLLFIIIAILLLNPFNFWMPNMLLMVILALALIIFGVFISFVLREKVLDERDNVHRQLAGRNAFLTGSIVLVVGLMIQGYKHQIDPWLVLALVFMIVAKVATRIWSDKNF
jgi:peptidoglycan/LPS O-acetylase OafA/YrhL